MDGIDKIAHRVDHGPLVIIGGVDEDFLDVCFFDVECVQVLSRFLNIPPSHFHLSIRYQAIKLCACLNIHFDTILFKRHLFS